MRLPIALFALSLAVASPAFFSAAAASPDDDSIHDLVRQRLYNDPDIKGYNITVEVRQGVVTLTGAVTTDKARRKAEKLTRKVSGVKKVINNLRVAEEKPA